jgi:hypothetical protein
MELAELERKSDGRNGRRSLTGGSTGAGVGAAAGRGGRVATHWKMVAEGGMPAEGIRSGTGEAGAGADAEPGDELGTGK